MGNRGSQSLHRRAMDARINFNIPLSPVIPAIKIIILRLLIAVYSCPHGSELPTTGMFGS
jgi:hypothetical protein